MSIAYTSPPGATAFASGRVNKPDPDPTSATLIPGLQAERVDHARHLHARDALGAFEKLCVFLWRALRLLRRDQRAEHHRARQRRAKPSVHD
jgi:hypothetical protein